MEAQSAFVYFETKISPIEKNKIKCAGESVGERGKIRADYKVAIEMAFEKLFFFFFYLNQGRRKEET